MAGLGSKTSTRWPRKGEVLGNPTLESEEGREAERERYKAALLCQMSKAY